MNIQTFVCQWCDKTWSRPAARGHRPKYCPECRAQSAWQRKWFQCLGCGEMAWNVSEGKYCSTLCQMYHRHGPIWKPWPRPVRQPKKPKPPPFVPIEANCAWCGITFTKRIATHKFCTRWHKMKASHARRRAAEVGAIGTYTWSELTQLWMSIDKTCAYCGQPKRNGEIEPDHVIPLSRGGSNSIINIAPSCSPCNSDKRDLTLTDWSKDRERRGLEPRMIDPRLATRGREGRRRTRPATPA